MKFSNYQGIVIVHASQLLLTEKSAAVARADIRFVRAVGDCSGPIAPVGIEIGCLLRGK